MNRKILAALVFLHFMLTVSGCAIDTPAYNSGSRTACRSSFDIDTPYYSYFNYSGNLNGLALGDTAIVTPIAPVSAASTRQLVIGAGFFSLTINVTSSSYGTKTIATGNPEVWMSAVTCGDYYSCSTEKYIAGYYSGTLRGSGTVTLSRTSAGTTQIVVNATMPDENTSVAQSLQFQNVTFSEVCH